MSHLQLLQHPLERKALDATSAERLVYHSAPRDLAFQPLLLLLCLLHPLGSLCYKALQLSHLCCVGVGTPLAAAQLLLHMRELRTCAYNAHNCLDAGALHKGIKDGKFSSGHLNVTRQLHAALRSEDAEMELEGFRARG